MVRPFSRAVKISYDAYSKRRGLVKEKEALFAVLRAIVEGSHERVTARRRAILGCGDVGWSTGGEKHDVLQAHRASRSENVRRVPMEPQRALHMLHDACA